MYLSVMDDSDIERELNEAQADVIKAREAPARRRRAVMLAREHGWSKYKIAATLGVKGPTVDSIIESAERSGSDQQRPSSS
jgi:DNA-directed RNA polymerase specialized sigma24 family protein